MAINSTPTTKFHPDIPDYFLINGFEKPKMDPIPNGMLFLKGNTAVQFWKQKIEVRRNNGVHWELYKSYSGFDGSIFQLMMLMHLMDVINLKEVKDAAVMEQIESELFQIA